MTTDTTHQDGQNTRLFLQLFALSMAVRIIFAAFAPLGVDETYAISVAREFSWSFFDHPPVGFWSPVAMANLFGNESPLVFRLLTLIFGAVTTLAIFGIGKELSGTRAALWGAAIYMIAPAFFLSGFFANPDSPLNAGSSVCVYWLVRIAKAEHPAPLRYWIFAALALAVALGSKYQAALIPISALGFAILSPVGRGWFRTPGPYVASVIALVGLLPVLIWNLQNDWASFSFHAARTGQGINFVNYAAMVVGQMLYLSPPILIIGLIGIWRALRSGIPERLLLGLIALGPILAFNVIYFLSKHSLAHWAMPGWLFALPLAGIWLASIEERALRRVKQWLAGFGLLNGLIFLLLILHLNTGVITRFTHETPPVWDDTLEAFDYTDLEKHLQAAGALEGVELIVARDWIYGGLVSTGLGGDWPVRILGNSRHHFQFMTAHDAAGTALFLEPVLPGDFHRLDMIPTLVTRYDPAAVLLDPITLERGGLPYIKVQVIRMTLAKSGG